jgi:hypothetical protein
MNMSISVTALKEELDTVIHLRSRFGPNHAGMSISPVKNPLTREYPSCVRNVDSSGNIILGKDDNPLDYFVRTTDRFFIKDGDEFDLSNPIKAKQWEAIKFSDLIFDNKGKFDENGKMLVGPEEKIGPQAVYYVERIIEDTKKRNTASRKLNKALNYIFNASRDALRIRAMLLGKYIKDAYDEEIEEFLTEIAKKDADKIISLFESNDTKYLIAFTYAKQKGILRQKAGLYTYNDNDIIGRDADSCIDFMKNPKNKLITDRILREIQEISVKDKDVIIEAISEDNKRIEDLKAKNEVSSTQSFLDGSKSDSEILKDLEDAEKTPLENKSKPTSEASK